MLIIIQSNEEPQHKASVMSQCIRTVTSLDCSFGCDMTNLIDVMENSKGIRGNHILTAGEKLSGV